MNRDWTQGAEVVGVTMKAARIEVEKIIGRGTGNVSVEIPFTIRGKHVLEFSMEEAKNLGHSYIGSEHLLLGIVKEGEGVAIKVLTQLGANLNDICTKVIHLVSENAELAYNEGGKSASSGKLPTLEEYGTDLTKIAEEGKLDPVVGREEQIERVTQILGRRTKNNPCLIGEPGVGKTAIAEGLAQRIVEGTVPETLENKKVITLDMGMLVAGTKYRGEFEERIKKLMDEVRQTKDIILFIDEVHTLIGAGGAEGAIDAANILKPALARGELQCIGATTLDEYRKHIEKDPALERRFQPVVVPEPTVDEAIQILRGLKERYELHHKLNYTDGALVAAAELAHQYISDHFVPDKGIDLIDEAGSRVQLKHAKSQHNCPSIYGSLWSRCSCQWIWHDWSDELCLQLLKNCHRALPENSKVIIVDVILPVEADTQISSHVGYHVDFLMLAYNPGGEEHTPYEFKDLAKQSGFEGGIKVICTINSISVMEFYKNK